jgi:hypothetical protein
MERTQPASSEHTSTRRVFISYATKDGLSYAQKAREALVSRGVDAFLEKHHVDPGGASWLRIGAEIANRDLFLLVGTPGTYFSYGVALEVECALNWKKPVVTLRFNDAQIFEILYGPKFDVFNDNSELVSACENVDKRFESIITEHKRHFLRTQAQAEGANAEPPVFILSGYQRLPTEDHSGLIKIVVENARKSIYRGYETKTLVPMLANVRNYSPSVDSDRQMTKISRSFYLPVETFQKPDTAVDLYSVGMEIALGERVFLNRKLFAGNPPKVLDDDRLQMQTLRQVVRELKDAGFQPNRMLAPVSRYTETIMGWMKDDPKTVKWDGPRLVLAPDTDTDVMIFWSNVYVQHEEFLILDSRIGEWVIKGDPNTGRAVTARISRNKLYPDSRVEVLANTEVDYELKRPEGLRILRLAR